MGRSGLRRIEPDSNEEWQRWPDMDDRAGGLEIDLTDGAWRRPSSSPSAARPPVPALLRGVQSCQGRPGSSRCQRLALLDECCLESETSSSGRDSSDAEHVIGDDVHDWKVAHVGAVDEDDVEGSGRGDELGSTVTVAVGPRGQRWFGDHDPRNWSFAAEVGTRDSKRCTQGGVSWSAIAASIWARCTSSKDLAELSRAD